MDEDDDLYVAQADRKDAFYHLELPPELRRFFGLRPVRAGAVGCTHIGGKAVHPNQMVTPRLAVVPMGWTWALWWCQKILETKAEEGGATDGQRVLDKLAAPSVERPIHVCYVDNFAAMGRRKADVTQL